MYKRKSPVKILDDKQDILSVATLAYKKLKLNDIQDRVIEHVHNPEDNDKSIKLAFDSKKKSKIDLRKEFDVKEREDALKANEKRHNQMFSEYDTERSLEGISQNNNTTFLVTKQNLIMKASAEHSKKIEDYSYIDEPYDKNKQPRMTNQVNLDLKNLRNDEKIPQVDNDMNDCDAQNLKHKFIIKTDLRNSKKILVNRKFPNESSKNKIDDFAKDDHQDSTSYQIFSSSSEVRISAKSLTYEVMKTKKPMNHDSIDELPENQSIIINCENDNEIESRHKDNNNCISKSIPKKSFESEVSSLGINENTRDAGGHEQIINEMFPSMKKCIPLSTMAETSSSSIITTTETDCNNNKKSQMIIKPNIMRNNSIMNMNKSKSIQENKFYNRFKINHDKFNSRFGKSKPIRSTSTRSIFHKNNNTSGLINKCKSFNKQNIHSDNNTEQKILIFEEELKVLKKEKEDLLRLKIHFEEENKILVNKNEYISDCLKQKELDLLNKSNEIDQLKNQLNISEYYRVSLHNYLQELRGNLRIFCRIKPVKQDTNVVINVPEKETLNMQTNNNTQHRQYRTIEITGQNQKKSIFFFDRVFDQTSTQAEIFEEIMPFVQSATDGDHVCILAYGQTGSGKTFTMEGPNLGSGKGITKDSGILPRVVDFIFKEKKRLEYQGKKIDLQMACVEIYNDTLTDLLASDAAKSANSNVNASQTEKLSIIYQLGKVIVNGLTWINIQDNQQLLELVIKASISRMVEKTNWNERSSRGHCIYKLKLIQNDNKEGLLNIVDLAGSERGDPNSIDQKSASEINQMKKIQTEANFINKSLTTLGRIIRLVSEKKPANAIPYRESKLTRLLQDSLGGGAKTLMFINVCPSEENAFQSKESLKFSSKIAL